MKNKYKSIGKVENMNTVVILFFYLIIIYNDEFNNPFGKENAIALKGICTMGVIFRHLLGIFQNDGIAFALFKDGFLFVSIFFFFSGYGVTLKLENEKDKGKYLLHRIKKVLVPIIVPSIVFALLEMRDMKRFFSFGAFRRAELLVPYSWYVYTIILFYIVLTLISFVKSGGVKILLSFSALTIYIVYLFLENYNICWYMSCLPLGVGVAFALYNDYVLELLKKYYKYVLFLSLIAYQVCYSYYDYTNTKTCLLQNFSSVFFCLIIICITAKINIINRFTIFLGKNSLELYLSQGVSIYMLNRFYKGKSELLWCIIALGMDFLCAIVFRQITSFFMVTREKKVKEH